MHLIKITLLASLASIALGNCVRFADQCPAGTHAENEPEICRDLGYPPQYHLICVQGVKARQGSLDRWFPRGSSRQTPLHESMCGERGDPCDNFTDCCRSNCNFVIGECF
ncbi:hypothetical protein BGZ89_004376 [Linnemannia elongata]|nr:hypothetical protein BGZ89_004376 [Linnemannia elongata]